jgi:hypothetical protein
VSDIFISYSKLDRAKAQVLAKALEQEGWSVWWDPKIPPGKTFDEVIERALDTAKCVVVLWSKKSVLSDWVKTEAAEGKRRGILIPALIEDDVKIPLEFRRWNRRAGRCASTPQIAAFLFLETRQQNYIFVLEHANAYP